MLSVTDLSMSVPVMPNVSQDLKAQIEQLLLLLSERERYVIQRRFSLDELEKATLEEIGQHFDVTRERIRQIEKNAMQKLRRNVSNFDVRTINDAAYDFLKHKGGLAREDILLSELLSGKGQAYSMHGLRFLLSLDSRFERLQNTIKLAPYFRLASFSEALVQRACSASLDVLKSEGDVMPIADLRKMVVERDEECDVLSEDGFKSLFEINKDFKCVDGGVGLIVWKHIHPRTLRDKIYYVLRRKGSSLHFVDIANAITEHGFDNKSVNLQAVHNELIRHNDFILIGRGTYALQEWGYQSGTVADVIEHILKDKKELNEKEIVDEVLKRRQVKPITILLNLKNKPQFVRTGRKMYTMKKG